jgi:hypothetical protein
LFCCQGRPSLPDFWQKYTDMKVNTWVHRIGGRKVVCWAARERDLWSIDSLSFTSSQKNDEVERNEITKTG